MNEPVPAAQNENKAIIHYFCGPIFPLRLTTSSHAGLDRHRCLRPRLAVQRPTASEGDGGDERRVRGLSLMGKMVQHFPKIIYYLFSFLDRTGSYVAVLDINHVKLKVFINFEGHIYAKICHKKSGIKVIFSFLSDVCF